jgi:hypothetical protein
VQNQGEKESIMKESKVSTVRRRYARLPLALALGAMVLTPALIGVGASEAEASVAAKGETSITLSGDARLRGYWREDAQFGNRTTVVDEAVVSNDDTNRQFEHRMRLYLDAKAAGGTSLHARILATTDDNDNRAHYQWGGNRNSNVATDYFYVNVPVGPVNVLVGRHLVNWGHRMKAWDARADRLRANYKINDEMTVFGYYQKDVEGQSFPIANIRNAEDEDQNRYSLGMVYNTADFRMGAQIRHTDQEWTGGEDGQELYGYATYKMADLTVNFEADFQFGDIWENAEGDKPFAMFLGFAYALGDTTLTLGGAYAGNGWQSAPGGHFDAVTMFYNTGGGHALGHSRLGQRSTDKEWAIGVGASHKLSPELTLGAKLAYVDGKNLAPVGMFGDDWDVTVVDASLAYKVNASTTYHIDAIYASPSLAAGFEDDAYWGLSNRFEIRF